MTLFQHDLTCANQRRVNSLVSTCGSQLQYMLMRHRLTFPSSPQENTDAPWVKDNQCSRTSPWFTGMVTLLIVTSIKNILVTVWLMCHVTVDLTFIFSVLTFCLPLGFPDVVNLQYRGCACCLLYVPPSQQIYFAFRFIQPLKSLLVEAIASCGVCKNKKKKHTEKQLI